MTDNGAHDDPSFPYLKRFIEFLDLGETEAADMKQVDLDRLLTRYEHCAVINAILAFHYQMGRDGWETLFDEGVSRDMKHPRHFIEQLIKTQTLDQYAGEGVDTSASARKRMLDFAANLMTYQSHIQLMREAAYVLFEEGVMDSGWMND